MEKLFNEKENEFSRMSAAVGNMNKSVAEKQKQIIAIQEDRDNKYMFYYMFKINLESPWK